MHIVAALSHAMPQLLVVGASIYYRRLGTESAAWAALQRKCSGVPAASAVWASDIEECCRQWLRKTKPDARILENITVRTFKRSKPGAPLAMITKDIDGNVFKAQRNAIDIYVCGFPCNPWSARG